MLPKIVSPFAVRLAELALTAVLYIPLHPLERAVNQRWFGLLHPRERPNPPVLFVAAYMASILLVRPVLSCLGIRVRGRSVERLRASNSDREEEVPDELPIRIDRGPGLVGVIRVIFLIGGLAGLVLAVCLLFTWFPPPGPRGDATLFTLGLLEVGVLLLGGAFLARRCKPELLCEVSEKGIRAPEGFWGRETFVSWDDLARCEIIHDDERIWFDHFVLWDRAGRRRFRSSENWLGRIRRSDRDRILRALRSRFLQKEKPGPDLEPALAHRASATVWDRDLDG